MTYEVSDFTENEINELRLYIEKHVPYHILNKMYILTDNVTDKITIFTGVYRIIKSCRNYTSSNETKEKLDYFLDKCKEAYELSSPLISKYSISLEMGKGNLIRGMLDIINKYHEVIDEFIDLFIVLGEHIQLMKTSATIGVSIRDNDEETKRLITESRKIAKQEGA